MASALRLAMSKAPGAATTSQPPAPAHPLPHPRSVPVLVVPVRETLLAEPLSHSLSRGQRCTVTSHRQRTPDTPRHPSSPQRPKTGTSPAPLPTSIVPFLASTERPSTHGLSTYRLQQPHTEWRIRDGNRLVYGTYATKRPSRPWPSAQQPTRVLHAQPEANQPRKASQGETPRWRLANISEVP